MKLKNYVFSRFFLTYTILLAFWSFGFYSAIVSEINDEADDALEDYSTQLIMKSLAGISLPEEVDGSNNTYAIRPITKKEAKYKYRQTYKDSAIYVDYKSEYEAARVLTTVFKNNHNEYFELTVMMPTFEKEDLKQSILICALILYILLTITILTINALVFSKSMKPFYKLLDWIESHKLGESRPMPQKSTDIEEFQLLSDTVFKNIQQAEEVYAQQKQFISNASHELQTPIAICQNRLEALAETNLTETQLEEVGKTLTTLSSMSKLNRTLLFLSKIENLQFTEIATVEPQLVVVELLPDLLEIFSHKNISVKTEFSNPLEWQMNQTLAETLVSNLLKNAFVHNKPNGTIHIYCTTNQFVVVNSGVNEELDSHKIFERFYSTKANGSSGLGLAIVRTICEVSGLSISYKFESGNHKFIVTRQKKHENAPK